MPKDYLKIILEKESRHIQCFEKILRRGVERGVCKTKDPFLLANIIVYLLSFGALRGWNFKKRYKVEEINQFLIEFIKNSTL